jgi:hypothetical protein
LTIYNSRLDNFSTTGSSPIINIVNAIGEDSILLDIANSSFSNNVA